MLVYQGVRNVLHRHFDKAVDQFQRCLDTFNAEEVLPFSKLVCYISLLTIVCKDRKFLKEKVVSNPEVLVVLRDSPLLEKFLMVFYKQQYQNFYQVLKEL